MKALNLTYFSLLFLLALTLGLSYLQLNLIFSELIALSIAAAKAFLIGAVFMQLKKENPSLRFIALAGLVWVGLLVTIISSDYVSRGTVGILGK